MWKSSEYFDFSSSWDCDHDPNFLATYSVVSSVDDWTSDITEEGTKSFESNTITCTRNCHSCALEINCTCKPHYNLSVVGIEIISEVRTIELYSDNEGYLQTARGSRIREKPGEEGTCCDHEAFYCSIKLEKSTEQISLKFMGLGERSSLQINKLHFILVQNEGSPNSNSTLTSPGMIDMSKVKGYLHSMGDQVPEQGTKLMKAVEEYQQSQMSQLGRFSSMMDPGNSDVLSNLLSMVTKSHDTKVTNQNYSHVQNEPVGKPVSNQKEIPPTGPLAAMLMSRSHGQGDSQGQDGMFAMLKNICGKVSEMRLNGPNPENKEGQIEDKQGEVQECRTRLEPSADVGASHGEHEFARLTESELESLQVAATQTVSQMIKQSEERIIKYIDTSLQAMEARLSHKLDILTKLLQKDQSLTDHKPLEDS